MDIGAWDWNASAWAADLYPEDLPADWRLGFYSGLFRCVALPASVWREAAADRWAEWAADVPENFGFYLEQGEAAAAELEAAARALGPLLHGVLLNPAGTAPQLAASQWLWPAALPQGSPLAAVGARVWQARNTRSSAVQAEIQAEIVDNAGSLQSPLHGYACLGMCCLPGLDGAEIWSPRRLRQMLEAIAALRLCAVVVDSGPDALMVMQQLETLSGLLDF